MTDYDDDQRAVVLAEAKERQQREDNDIKFVMSSEQGRRVVWDLLSRGKVFASTFTADAQVTAFNEGQRNLALSLFSKVMAVCPDLYLTMAAEAAKEN